MIEPLHRAALDAQFAFLVALRLIERGNPEQAYKLLFAAGSAGVHIVVEGGVRKVRIGLPTDRTQPKELI